MCTASTSTICWDERSKNFGLLVIISGCAAKGHLQNKCDEGSDSQTAPKNGETNDDNHPKIEIKSGFDIFWLLSDILAAFPRSFHLKMEADVRPKLMCELFTFRMY
jgi:hypothetical protein